MPFNTLRKFQIQPERTFDVELPGIILAGCDAPPVLTVRHAGDENKAFVNARAKAQTDLRAIGSGQSAAAQRARLVANARMLAQGDVVVRWRNVRDDDAPEVDSPCTREKVEELLVGLVESTPDLFTRVIEAALTVSNFRDAPVVDAEALGKA